MQCGCKYFQIDLLIRFTILYQTSVQDKSMYFHNYKKQWKEINKKFITDALAIMNSVKHPLVDPNAKFVIPDNYDMTSDCCINFVCGNFTHSTGFEFSPRIYKNEQFPFNKITYIRLWRYYDVDSNHSSQYTLRKGHVYIGFNDRLTYNVKENVIKYLNEYVASEMVSKIRQCNLSNVTFDGDEYSITMFGDLYSPVYDSRYLEVSNQVSKITKDIKLVDMTSYEDVINIAKEFAIEVNQRKIDMMNRYTKYVSDNGGCTIKLDGKLIIAHRSFRPTINTNFLMFKCPYTEELVTINIASVKSITIKGMDEYHGQTIPLLG